MRADIDIVVSSADSTDSLLIVETKLSDRDPSNPEAQLKQYMLQLSCPVGLIVTPEKMRIYADRYTSRNSDSIERVGEFAIGHLLQFKSGSEAFFQDAVQHWLENLPQTASPERVNNSELWRALNIYVLPAIEAGKVRAAVPRYR
ncbi:MAG TPA: hypothetical protein VEI73_06515 [Candidatus Acidoferrum sp.]|nr:hypothetical protein [Candidatus Acidoferrum sp.]